MFSDSKGCIKSYSSSGGGGHSVVICGYLPDEVVGVRSTQGWWELMKNSWGSKGVTAALPMLTLSAFDLMCKQTVIGRSDMITPIPKVERILDFTADGNSMYA